jgi:hypothetical protein
MTLPMLLGYGIAADVNAVAAILTAHTCPNDGYVYAWQDSVDPTLVWEMTACPVDAIKVNLITNIGNWVNARYNYSDKYPDPLDRVLDIISGVKDDAMKWLDEHATARVALFLKDDLMLHKLIFNEMRNQGIVA